MKEKIGAKSHSKPAEEGFTRWLSCVNLLDQRKKKDLIYTNLSPYLCLDKSSHLCMTLFFLSVYWSTNQRAAHPTLLVFQK